METYQVGTFKVLMAFFNAPPKTPEAVHQQLSGPTHHEGTRAFGWYDSDFGLHGARYQCLRWTRCIVSHVPKPDYLRNPESNAIVITSSMIIDALRQGKVEGPFEGHGPSFVAWGRYQPEGPTGPLVIIYMTKRPE